MPCTYDEYGPGVSSGPTPTEKKLKAELDLATRVACKLARTLSVYGDAADGLTDLRDILAENTYMTDLDEEVFAWIENHEKQDAIRKAALIESAKAKLTDDEREALGL